MLAGLALTGVSLSERAAAQPGPETLAEAVASSLRSPANVARDRYRHPLAALEFYGLRPGMTVVEIAPGGGYWTEILAPYLHRSGGRYIAAIEGDSAHFLARFADTSLWGKIVVAPLAKGPMGPDGTADLVLTTRNLHDWVADPAVLDAVLSESHAVLKPGGVLAVTDHRADPRPMLADASDGYVNTDWVVKHVSAAGFKLDGQSEMHANPKDDKTHPFGVWTLPPTLRSHARGQPVPAGYDAATYLAIGESDRMTLRFVKV